MNEDDAEGARTEAPSAHALEQARARGDVPEAPLAQTAAAVLGLSAVAAVAGPAAMERLSTLARASLSLEGLATPREALLGALAAAASIAALPLAVLLVAGVASAVLVSGPTFAPGALGAARGLSAPRARDLAVFLARLLVSAMVLLIAAGLVREVLRGLLGRATLDAATLAGISGDVLLAFGARVGALLAIASAGAIAYARWRWWSDQRRSRRAAEREHRALEGDPEARRERDARRRELALAAGRARPTHLVYGDTFIVAIAWPDPRATPRVVRVLRGRPGPDERELPILDDALLARTLASVAPGREVPRHAWPRLARLLRGPTP